MVVIVHVDYNNDDSGCGEFDDDGYYNNGDYGDCCGHGHDYGNNDGNLMMMVVFVVVIVIMVVMMVMMMIILVRI